MRSIRNVLDLHVALLDAMKIKFISMTVSASRVFMCCSGQTSIPMQKKKKKTNKRYTLILHRFIQYILVDYISLFKTHLYVYRLITLIIT